MEGIFAQLQQQLVNGLTLGSVYALIALGYSMVYGTLEMLNFAHGEVFMIGAFMGWGVLGLFLKGTAIIVTPIIVIPLMIVIAMAGTAALGVGIEWFAYRPLRNAPRLAPLISALAVSIFLRNFVVLTMTARAKVYDTQLLIPMSWQVSVGQATISFIRILVIGVSIVLMVALDRFIRRSKLGRAMRATAQDREAASFMGISVDRVISMTFLIGSALAGAGGVLVGMYYTQIDFYMGYSAGMKAFTAAVLGGIGNIRGAMLGGLMLGLVESLGVAFISPVYKDLIAFSMLILILVFKPSGLLGEQVPVKV
ncbi:MAG: branched-chain amino acid ABC transporter permease [Rectinemataceae bacterium]